MSLMAVAFAAATLLAGPPARAAIAVLQPQKILLDQSDQASVNSVVTVRGRGGFGGSFRGGRGGFGGGSFAWRRGGMGGGWRGAGWGGRWHGGNWGNRWHGGRWVGRWRGGNWNNRWYGRGWGYRRFGWGAPWGWGGVYAVGRPCGYGFRWTYRWGCVPVYGYGYGYY
jgi:hypothetical protein